MRIPTPNLIKELRRPIEYKSTFFVLNSMPPSEQKRLEKILKEAAEQLEWFLENEKRKGELL